MYTCGLCALEKFRPARLPASRCVPTVLWTNALGVDTSSSATHTDRRTAAHVVAVACMHHVVYYYIHMRMLLLIQAWRHGGLVVACVYGYIVQYARRSVYNVI
jgi:hypothetical protein